MWHLHIYGCINLYLWKNLPECSTFHNEKKCYVREWKWSTLCQGHMNARKEANFYVPKNKWGWTASGGESEKEPWWHWDVCMARSFVSPLKTELMDSAPKHFKTPPQCKPVNSQHTSPQRTNCHISLQPLLSWVRCWESNEVTTARLNIQIYSLLAFIRLHIYIIIRFTWTGSLRVENILPVNSLGRCWRL